MIKAIVICTCDRTMFEHRINRAIAGDEVDDIKLSTHFDSVQQKDVFTAVITFKKGE